MKKESGLNRLFSLALSVSTGAAFALPGPAIISIFWTCLFHLTYKGLNGLASASLTITLKSNPLPKVTQLWTLGGT